jgi:hypothetical protein
VQGPDAAEFLNRVYINGFGKLPVGRARYGIMLRDDGIVMDDGTTWRLSDTDFFMTTTTANAVKVMGFLEELLETRWPDLRVRVTTVSEQWAGLAVAGPKAREVLEAVVEDIDMSNEAFPFMGVREGRIGGAQCRVARISFSGEMAYEAYVPSDYGAAMCDAVWKAAEPLGGILYGTEALGALRIEKGHVAGPELDGRTTLEDLHLDRMASSKKPFIGNVLRKRTGLMADDRPQLVGIMPKDLSQRIASRAGQAQRPWRGLGDLGYLQPRTRPLDRPRPDPRRGGGLERQDRDPSRPGAQRQYRGRDHRNPFCRFGREQDACLRNFPPSRRITTPARPAMSARTAPASPCERSAMPACGRYRAGRKRWTLSARRWPASSARTPRPARCNRRPAPRARCCVSSPSSGG